MLVVGLPGILINPTILVARRPDLEVSLPETTSILQCPFFRVGYAYTVVYANNLVSWWVGLLGYAHCISYIRVRGMSPPSPEKSEKPSWNPG